MKKLVSLYENLDLLMELTVAADDFDQLGFVYFKHLVECEGFEDGPYRGVVVYKPLEDDENAVYIATLADQGNGYFSLLWIDTPIKEILEANELLSI